MSDGFRARFASFHPVIDDLLAAIQESAHRHPFLACQLQGKEPDIAPFDGYIEVTLLIRMQAADGKIVRSRSFLCLIDLQHLAIALRRYQLCPGSGVGGKAADEIVDPLHRLLPVDVTSLLEDLRCRP